MADIAPYKIEVPQWKLADLQKRLALAKFPEDELEGAEWDYGVPLADVKRLTLFWRDQFDWPKAQEKLNQLPHFTTSIQCDGFESLEIHFIHQKSDVDGAIPLLFVHGWPGSFLEATKIIKELTSNGNHPAFHFVALSLPNYGFSEGPRKKGFAIEQYAETCNKLMLKLGYNEYATQGGDWG
jgi:pimeloyl-ACP methyl ester carboxylesterase